VSLPEIPGEPLERVVEVHHHHYYSGGPPSDVDHGWMKYVVRDLETNPKTQYTVHKWGMYYWLLNFAAVALLFFLTPSLWLKLGVFIILEYSIYANFATDYGAMSAAMAAMTSEGVTSGPDADEANERLGGHNEAAAG
jgi:hypothetical protein